MNNKAEVGSTLKIVGAVLVVLLVLGVLSITTFLVLSNLTPVITSSATSRSVLQTLTPVVTISVNGTGYTFEDCNARAGGLLNSIVAVNQSGTSLSSSNYTLSNCKVTAVGGSGYKDQFWNVTSGDYTYIVSSENVNTIANNVTTGVTGFFTQIPVIMTILGVVILIGAVILIIVFVKRLGGGGAL